MPLPKRLSIIQDLRDFSGVELTPKHQALLDENLERIVFESNRLEYEIISNVKSITPSRALSITSTFLAARLTVAMKSGRTLT